MPAKWTFFGVFFVAELIAAVLAVATPGFSADAPRRPNDRGFDHFHEFLSDTMDDDHKHRRHEINDMRLDRAEIDPPGQNQRR